MEPQLQDIGQVQERLLKLERQNRRFKQLGAITLIVVAALLVMGQAAAPRKTVEASAFILRDARGNVRGSLSVGEKTSAAQFVLLDDKGKQRMKVASGFYPYSGIGAMLTLDDEQGRDRLYLEASDSVGGALSMSDQKGSSLITRGHAALPYVTAKLIELMGADGKVGFVADPTNLAFVDSKGVPTMTLSKDALHISDDQGFAAALGATDLITPRTGESHKTSAASIALFDKDKRVLWRAP